MRRLKLIYKAVETYLPTAYPAFYYGSPDNKVYVVYASPYLTPGGKSGREFILARHDEFTYNYLEDHLVEIITKKTPLLSSLVDKRNLRITHIKTYKSCKTYEEAEELLHKWIAQAMTKPAIVTTTSSNKKPE